MIIISQRHANPISVAAKVGQSFRSEVAPASTWLDFVGRHGPIFAKDPAVAIAKSAFVELRQMFFAMRPPDCA
jgi:hypothetical protein